MNTPALLAAAMAGITALAVRPSERTGVPRLWSAEALAGCPSCCGCLRRGGRCDSHLIYPQAVGGDIGCGMLAVGFDVEAAALTDPGVAGRVLGGLGRAVPARRRNRREAIAAPSEVTNATLSHPSLEAVRRNEGLIEFATLGSGNHFIELQSDEEGRLWLMVHSGSRGIGPAIRDHHLAQGEDVGGGLRALDATGDQGAQYLSDAAWARRFADASRRAMADQVGTGVIEAVVGARLSWETVMTTDHNLVSFERHEGRESWGHRKGAMPAGLGQGGVLPGSMGSASFQGRARRGTRSAFRILAGETTQR